MLNRPILYSEFRSRGPNDWFHAIHYDDTRRWAPGLLEELIATGVLVPTTPAKSAVCEECHLGHCEEVFYLESPPGTGLRAYIWCEEAGRVRIPLERLKRWEVDRSRIPPEPDSPPAASPSPVFTPAADTDEPLNDRGQTLLVAMYELGAFDSDHRKSTDIIASTAFGPDMHANSIRRPMGALRRLKMIISKGGNGGGCWLSDKGRRRAEKLRTRDAKST